MKIFAKKTVAMLLLFAMLVTALPTSVFAAHRPDDGYPTNLMDNVILSVNTATVFPGEPTTHLVTSNYVSFDSSFDKTSGWWESYNTRASNVLKSNILNDVKQGTTVVDGNNTHYVWGIFNTSSGAASDVFADYFVQGRSNPIFNDANETKMIAKAKKISETEAANYEIIWYVVKYQTSDTAWHIDGIIRERDKYSVNYYGNSNTGGTAPTGTNSLSLNDKYTVLGNTGNLERVVAGVTYEFAGWNTKADGTGTTYQAGDVVDVNTTNFPEHTLTLYAKWVTKGNYKATAKLYVDNELTNIEVIHPNVNKLMISHNGTDFIDLSEDSTGVYSATVNANGNYSFYHRENGNELHKIGTYTIPIYNSNGTLEVRHWSVNYHSEGGFSDDSAHRSVHYAGTVTNVVAQAPERAGYIFRGWNTKDDGSGTTYQPGDALPALTAPVDLYAQYEATTTARVNVTLNHGSDSHGNNIYETRDDVSFELVSRSGAGQSYSRVDDTFVDLPDDMDSKFDKTEGVDAKGKPTTVYTATAATYTELPANAEYSVAISKKNYNVDSVTATKDPTTGEWVINVELTFDPLSHELVFGVEMKDGIPSEYYPAAVVAKVYFWDEETDSWLVIEQHKEGIPGVRIDIDKATRFDHTASYPVWGVDGDGNPYGYRFVITGFIHRDGTTHAATPVAAGSELTQWTDGTYTATLNADLPAYDAFTAGGHDGAIFDNEGNQQGKLTALITMDLYNVTFHANAEGATIEGKKEFTMEYQYEMPDLESYPPNHMDGNYVFGGWYLDSACTQKAVSGTDLTEDVDLYAKWKAPLTIRGTVKANGTYMLNDDPVYIHEADRITSAEVVLEVVGTLGSVAQQEVQFTDYSAGYATAEYSFTVPDDGTEYEVMTRVLNYTTGYDNEPINGTYVVMNDTEDLENPANDAIYDGDDKAVVNIELNFEPDSFNQRVVVEADEIGEGFRPTDALAVIRYRNVGETHFPNIISQHAIENGGTGGIEIDLDEDLNGNSAAAEGDGEESIWEYHYSGTIYEYHIGIAKLFGDVEDAYNADGSIVEDPPYHVVHSDATSWSIHEDELVGGEDGVLVARLYPNEYDVVFNLNTEDTVTNMESFLKADGRYMTTYLWSYGADVTAAAPQRANYQFLGWFEDLDGDKAMGDSEKYVTAINAAEHRDITLTADWKINSHTVTWKNWDGSELKTETYDYGVTPRYTGETPKRPDTAQFDYEFAGWTPDIVPVTKDATYTATYTATLNSYTVTWKNWDGSTLGTETYEHGEMPDYKGENPERPDTAQYDYEFAGWTPTVVAVTGDATYTATYTKTTNKYTVTWLDDNGSQLAEEEYEYGATPAYPHANPEKQDTAQYDYTFSGWTPTVVEVTRDATYTATYTTNTNAYTVTYTDGVAGEEIFRDEVYSNIAYGSTTPEFKTSVNRPGYNLIGWAPTFDATVTGNATYVAVWKEIEYTVTWVDEDDTSVLATKTYLYNEIPVYPYANPEKQDTAQYNYEFSGWTPDIVPVTANATYKAQYSATLNSYTVTWKNWDGSTLGTETYEHGEKPDYKGETPERPDTAQYTYEFADWTPTIVEVTGDATYTATYTETTKKYTVTWKNWDGSVIETETYDYGVTPSYTDEPPKRPDTAQYTYEFDDWDKTRVPVTEDTTYTATYTKTTNKYTVTWLDDDGQQLAKQEYEYGKTPVYPNGTPKKQDTAEFDYTFSGWTPAIVMVTEDATYTATYTKTTNKYTVKWLNYDGELLLEEEYDYGETPAYVGTPTKAPTAQYSYEFAGWTPAIVEVTEDATYTATYTETVNTYTVQWLNDDGSLLLAETYEYGETPAYAGTPAKAPTAYHTYTFKGWTPDIVAVTENATYTAQYTAVGTSVSRDPSQNPNTGVRCLMFGR